jgi:hypothetical protein
MLRENSLESHRPFENIVEEDLHPVPAHIIKRTLKLLNENITLWSSGPLTA